jgi:hypothetical protein
MLLEGDRVPDWHLKVLSDREDEAGGESWDVVEARILDAVRGTLVQPTFRT